jgi:hypothetical protein
MKTPLIIPAVIIIVLLVGCRPEENPEQLKMVNQALEYANGVIQDENHIVYNELIEKQKDPQTASSAEIWVPKANQIRQYADSIKAQIENIKSDLLAQTDSLKRDYVDLTRDLHSVDGIGYRLVNKLADFKDSSRAAIYSGADSISQPFIKKDLGILFKSSPLLRGYGDSLSADQRSEYKRKWLEASFGRSSALMAMIMLNKIQSDVLAAERMLIEYCRNKIPTPCFSYDRFKAIGALSSAYVKAGQSIEVTAGVGSFTAYAKPRITIDGKEIKLDQDAVAVYKFVATGKPGKHWVPVTIEFSKRDGSRETVWKRCEYVITAEK